MEAFIREREKNPVKNKTRLYVFTKKYAHGNIMFKKRYLTMFSSLGGTLYMCVYMNTLLYLCRPRNVYNVATILLTVETLVVVVGIGERGNGTP